jgi:hypothetical protein
MTIRFWTPARIGLVCAVLACTACDGGGGVLGDEYVQTYPLSGRASVHVHAQWGAVHIVTNDGNKVEFDVKYDREQWASALPIESRQDGNDVTLTARVDEHSWWGWGTFSDHRLNITVRMPKDADLQLQTTNGDIDVATVNGHILIETRNGRVAAQQLSGTIDVVSTNGEINLDALKGEMSVHTTNGPITATGMDGKCALSTTNGQVRVEGRFDSLDIDSTNGGVIARAESGSAILSGWNIGTTNGRVDLSVPMDFKANLHASTNNGRIKVDLPVTLQGYEDHNQVRGTLNGGGPDMSIHTTNASIRLRGI